MSFEKLSEITRMENGYASLIELILHQYQNISAQNYVPNGLSSDPEQKKKDDLAGMMVKAKEKLDGQYSQYLSLVENSWEKHLSKDEIRQLSEALDNAQVKKFFDVSNKTQADLKITMQPFTQGLFQLIQEK